MPRHFLCFNLRSGAFFMVVVTTILGAVCLLADLEKNDFFSNEVYMKQAYYPLIMGASLIISALFLLHGTLKNKPNWIFLYLVVSSTCLFILTVTIAICAPILLLIIAVFWFGQICVNSYYKLIVDAKDFFGEVTAAFNGDITIVHIV